MPGPLRALGRRQPRLVLALRAAFAAAGAWACVVPMGGAANTYAYFAPFGAVIAVTGTVAGSIRGSVQGVVAVMIGATLALAVRPLAAWEVLGLALVVGVGTVIAGWRRLGTMASWVPIAAMFVLIPGRADPERYLIGYVGLTSLGACVGILANLVFAPLPLSRSGSRVRQLRDALADELSDLATGLRHDHPPTREEWDEHRRDLLPLTRDMSRMVDEASEARRANWRASHWVRTADQQYELARSLEELAHLVEDMSAMLTHNEVAGAEHIALGPELRPIAADLLDAMSDLLRELDGASSRDGPVRRVDDAMNALVDRIREARGATGDDLFTAGALVISVRRAVSALVPDDLADELPSRH